MGFRISECEEWGFGVLRAEVRNSGGASGNPSENVKAARPDTGGAVTNAD